MGTWQDGYVIDVPYVAGFYRELSPAYLAPARGPPWRAAAGRRSTAISPTASSAAAGVSARCCSARRIRAERFHGYDFNADADRASCDELGGAGRPGERCTSATSRFADLAPRSGVADDGPRFDLIVLHGVYSWVSAENRRHIARFIRRSPRARRHGLRQLQLHAGLGRRARRSSACCASSCCAGAAAATRTRRSALAFVKELAARGAYYFRSQRVRSTRYLEQPRPTRTVAYLAHEYLNEHWDALYHLDVARDMEGRRPRATSALRRRARTSRRIVGAAGDRGDVRRRRPAHGRDPRRISPATAGFAATSSCATRNRSRDRTSSTRSGASASCWPSSRGARRRRWRRRPAR